MLEFNITFNQNFEDLISDAVDIFGYEIEPGDKEIWEVAREYDDIPHFANIYASLFLSNLENELTKINPKIEFEEYINSFCTSINYKINDDKSREITDLNRLLAEL